MNHQLHLIKWLDDSIKYHKQIKIIVILYILPKDFILILIFYVEFPGILL